MKEFLGDQGLVPVVSFTILCVDLNRNQGIKRVLCVRVAEAGNASRSSWWTARKPATDFSSIPKLDRRGGDTIVHLIV